MAQKAEDLLSLLWNQMTADADQCYIESHSQLDLS
jgi:hypothetical protein